MKNLFIFIISVVIGTIGLHPSESFADIILAKKEKILPLSKLKVFQAVGENGVLVAEDAEDSEPIWPDSQLYLLVPDAEELYYDNQKIRVPNGKVVKMIGVYQYESMIGIRTIPAIRIDSLPKKKKSK